MVQISISYICFKYLLKFFHICKCTFFDVNKTFWNLHLIINLLFYIEFILHFSYSIKYMVTFKHIKCLCVWNDRMYFQHRINLNICVANPWKIETITEIFTQYNRISKLHKTVEYSRNFLFWIQDSSSYT